MCVILIGKVDKKLHKQALVQNGDGFSVYSEELGLVKAPTPAQVKKALGKFAIWHYRIATSGVITDINIHPFEICGGDYLLYHNGILGNGLGEKSDTHALADMLYDLDIKVASAIIESLSARSRFVIANAKNPKDFKVYGSWEAESGVLMSHKMYKYPVYSSPARRATLHNYGGWEEEFYENGGSKTSKKVSTRKPTVKSPGKK